LKRSKDDEDESSSVVGDESMEVSSSDEGNNEIEEALEDEDDDIDSETEVAFQFPEDDKNAVHHRRVAFELGNVMVVPLEINNEEPEEVEIETEVDPNALPLQLEVIAKEPEEELPDWGGLDDQSYDDDSFFNTNGNDIFLSDRVLVDDPAETGTLFPHAYTSHASPIIPSFPSPRYDTSRIPKYRYTERNAPLKRDSVITFETMGKSHVLADQPFQSLGIVSFQSYVKEGRGLLWQNRTSCKLHYETSMHTYQNVVVPQAKQLKVPYQLFIPEGQSKVHKVIDGDNVFLLVSGGSFEDFHDKVHFQDLIRDACIQAPRTVPNLDSLRGNAGPTVGLASSQGTSRSTLEAYAAPRFHQGSIRYSKVFGIISDTTVALLSSCQLRQKLPPRDDGASGKQLSYQSACEKLAPANLYLSLSFKLYIHHPQNIANQDTHFNAHRDRNNPDCHSPNDIMFSAWETWFEPLLNLYVTGTIIACGRRSQEELYERMQTIESATSIIMTRLESLPFTRRRIDSGLLCPNHKEYVVQGCHLLQIHALTPNDYIHRLSLLLGGREGLSAFLAIEIVLAFHQTSNNSLRFHRFMNELLSSVEQYGDLRFLRGDATVVEKFQRYCIRKYGSLDGIQDRNGLKEGIQRHQATASCPISIFQNECSMRTLMLCLQTYGGTSSCNQATYSKLVKAIKKDVWGLGDLRAQKAIATCASLGLYLSESFLMYFETGSTQQLKNLKESPFHFQRSDQVDQLRRNLLFVNPHLLPMQADEYVCALSSRTNSCSFGEVIYSKHSIYNARKQADGSVAVFRLCSTSKRNEPAPKIKFNYSTNPDINHYVPYWVGGGGPLEGSGYVCLATLSNLDHKNTCRSLSRDKKFLPEGLMNASYFQSMLFQGSYVIIRNLQEELCEYLDRSTKQLKKAVTFKYNKRDSAVGDVTATLSLGSMHLPGKYMDLQSFAENCTPRIHCTKEGFYDDKDSADLAITLQTLMKYRVRGKQHWAQKFLTDRKSSPGFLLLVSLSRNNSCCFGMAYIYTELSEGTNVRTVSCSYLDEKGNGYTPFRIDNGYKS